MVTMDAISASTIAKLLGVHIFCFSFPRTLLPFSSVATVTLKLTFQKCSVFANTFAVARAIPAKVIEKVPSAPIPTDC